MTIAPVAPPACIRLVIVTLLAIATGAPVSADAPVPPTPDEAADVQPVAFAAAADRPPDAPPLPLTGSPAADRPLTAKRSPLRPLGDWTPLLAVATAFALVAAFRVTSLRRPKSLPPDVFELLGEASLGGQQTARVVRFGPRTLLIGVSSAGCQTLAEIEDPQATERIVMACRNDLAAVRTPPRSLRMQPAAKPAGGEVA